LYGFSPKLVVIIASGCPTSVPNISWYEGRVWELQQFFQVCEKIKKKLESLLTHILESLYTIFFSNNFFLFLVIVTVGITMGHFAGLVYNCLYVTADLWYVE